MGTRTKLKTRQIPVTTTVGDPGVDTLLPTEKSVRTELLQSRPVYVNHSQLVMTIEGTELSDDGVGIKSLKFRLPYVGAGAVIEEIYATLGTAPDSANIRVNILNIGTTIFSGTEYIEIATGQNSVSRTTNFVNSGSIAKNDYFQIELVQGDDVASDLVVHLRYKWNMLYQDEE